jgi:hypothetical protein
LFKHVIVEYAKLTLDPKVMEKSSRFVTQKRNEILGQGGRLPKDHPVAIAERLARATRAGPEVTK